MFPNEDFRKASLKTTNLKLVKNIFGVTGILFVVTGMILVLILWGNYIEGSNNGVPTGVYVPAWIIGVIVAGFGILFTLVGFLFIPAVSNAVSKGEILYPVAATKISREELFKSALLLNDSKDNNLSTEVNGNWIDFSLNWKNCFSVDIFNMNLNRTIEVYKKLIYVYDDFTYDELDCEALATLRGGVLNFAGHANVKCGKLSHRSIEYNFGKDFNSEETGINKYSIDTVEVTNQVHKWLADRGYQRR